MQWITDEDLKTWSRRTDARELFVDLVGDLIRATVADIRKFRFPGQSSGTLRGFDGDLETTTAISRIPAKHSKWEFGTTPASKNKAQADYDNRTTSTPTEVMAENAFVMVNLHSWDTPRETLVNWLAEREAEKKWREVHFIDGSALVSWLEEKPAVAARYAKNVLEKAPRNGALSTDEFWERYSRSFKPALSEKMLLCGRENEATQLLQVLNGGPQNFTLAADSAEEIIAFAVAVIRTAPENIRELLEAKTMVVETFDAAQFLLGMKNMIFLVWKGADELAGSLGQIGPTLTAASGLQRKRQGIPILERPSANAMAEAMTSMGIDRQEGYERAFKCGRSLTILRRLHPAAGVAPEAEWANLAPYLKPALLAGGWTTDSVLDREIVASLAGETDYTRVEAPIRQTLAMSDPPFDKVEQVWQVRAAVDAFFYYGHLVDENDLRRLKDALIRVLSHQVPQPSADEQFSFDYRAPADFSDWLRDGLAYTLLLFATMHEVGGLQLTGTSPQQYVDSVIRSLPDFARSNRWILTILPQLSVVAEAAPIPFLEALEKSLEGQAEEALSLFNEPESNSYIFANTSPHVYVLWALEVLAWNPTFLSQVTILLGRLAAIDPGRKTNNSNRPLNSLREIFLPWSPNTDADLNQRFVAIDRLIQKLPEVAWDLLLLLLPRTQDIGSSTARPKLRDTRPLESEHITFGLVWETEDRVMDRVIFLSQRAEPRAVPLVSFLSNLRPENRKRLINLFAEVLSLSNNAQGCDLWHKLRDYVVRQEAFADADWTLKGDDLTCIKELLEQNRPSDIVAQTRYLFDDWLPDMVTNRGDIENERAKMLLNVYSEQGVEGLIRLAREVKLPMQMGPAFDALKLSYDDAANLIFALMDTGDGCYGLACLISGRFRYRDGDTWSSYFTEFIVPRCNSLKDIIQLLAYWPNNIETWTFIQNLGQEIADIYWREIGSLPWNVPSEVLQAAISELRRVGRSLTVLNSLHNNLKDISSDMLLSLLDESLYEIGEESINPSMFSYNISEVFTVLNGRDDVIPLEVARREFLYLPLIEHNVQGLSIHSVLAKEPTEYVSLIENVFVSKDYEGDFHPTEIQRARAKQSYRLLKSFHTIPGDHDGIIDEPTLLAWIVEVRRLSAQSGRGDITEEYVGQLLAHSKPNLATQVWPPVEVASVIEKIASDTLEHGIMIERFNMRGVYSKGLNEGGAQERELALQYRTWAGQATFPRTIAMLERISRDWEESAKQEDILAAQRKLKH